jgi:hypothetical protein
MRAEAHAISSQRMPILQQKIRGTRPRTRWVPVYRVPSKALRQ